MTNTDRELAAIKIDGKFINVTASDHAMGRMEKYNVDKYVVSGNVIALGPERIAALQKTREEAIIIDEVKNISVVVGFSKKTITIITVIDKANVFVKSNTQVYNL